MVGDKGHLKKSLTALVDYCGVVCRIMEVAGIPAKEKDVNLKAAIANKGFRQSALATLLGVSQSYLSLVIHGKRTIGPRLERRLRIIFGNEVEFLA